MENSSKIFLRECCVMNGVFQVINAELDRRLAEFTRHRQEEVWKKQMWEVKTKEKRVGIIRGEKSNADDVR